MQSRFRSIEIVAGPALWPSIGFVVAAGLAQTVFATLATFRGAVPSLVTSVVVLYAAQSGARRGALLGLIGGLFEDCFAGTGGTWTIATTLVGLTVGGIAKTIFSDGFFMLGVFVGAGVLLRDALFWIIMSVGGYPRGYALVHLHIALWQAALTSAVAVAYLIVRSRYVADRTAVERNP